MLDNDKKNYGKCVLASNCNEDVCKNDTYFLPGYVEDFRENQFSTMDFDSNSRRKFYCHCGYYS